MSVNIYDGTNLIPIAGKTVPAPTPDYVDEQYSSSTTYSKGMTCISGNKRYRYINSTASSGHQPPNATYWEVLSVSDEITSITRWYDMYNSGIQTLSGSNRRYTETNTVFLLSSLKSHGGKKIKIVGYTRSIGNTDWLSLSLSQEFSFDDAIYSNNVYFNATNGALAVQIDTYNKTIYIDTTIDINVQVRVLVQ